MLPWLSTARPRPLATVRDVPLAKVVRDDLLGRILRGQLLPGKRINEPDVARRLGISRVPVREALRELESSGLVVSRKNLGVFVRQLEAREVADLYELRGVLDGYAGGRAAGLREAPRRALLRILDAATAAMRKAERRRDVPEYYGENLRFHWAIVDAAGNDKLSETYRTVVQQCHLWRLRNLSQDAGMAASLAEHDEIVRAIRDAEPARAQRLLAAHVGAAHARLERHLQKEPSP